LALAIEQACAHMVMIEPHPFNLDTAPLLQVSPLGPELSFPCQNPKPTTEKVTTVTAGSTTLVKFQGSAVHGGGSCQFSVAYGDTPPSDASQWKTIYTIIGGCPAEAQGNIQDLGTDPAGRVTGTECGNDSGTECVRQFNIPVPKQMKNGKAIFAWTWFNKIGNREMYMNCAPIKIVGGSGDESVLNSLPSIFQANIPGQCTTGNGVLGFPDPGNFGKVNDQITPGSEGNCKPPSEPKFQTSSGDSSQPPVSNTQVSAAPPITSSVVVSSAAQAAPSQTIPSTSITIPESPVCPGQPAGTEKMVPCAVSGAVICISDTQFGLCNSGFAMPQNLAAGTVCRDGAII
ncbi:hypothetical protein BGZ63DRAFT_338411, partial [Mariannaea sp. PMI_226]